MRYSRWTLLVPQINETTRSALELTEMLVIKGANVEAVGGSIVFVPIPEHSLAILLLQQYSRLTPKLVL